MVKKLTKKQREVLLFIEHFIHKNGYSPTLKELSEHLSKFSEKAVATSTAQYYTELLDKKGYLKKNPNIERGLVPTRPKLKRVPLLGIIAAGKPIEPVEDEIPIEVPSSIPLKSQHQYYALRVSGNSMRNLGILNRDIVLIRHQLHAKNNDIIVAITEDGTTLKRYKTDGYISYLQPENNNLENIHPEYIEVRGIYEGLIRSESTES